MKKAVSATKARWLMQSMKRKAKKQKSLSDDVLHMYMLKLIAECQ